MGSAEGPSPFAGSLRVSLRYKFPLFLTRKSAKGIVERVFQHPARDGKWTWSGLVEGYKVVVDSSAAVGLTGLGA